jgi:hypothetical protein
MWFIDGPYCDGTASLTIEKKAEDVIYVSSIYNRSDSQSDYFDRGSNTEGLERRKVWPILKGLGATSCKAGRIRFKTKNAMALAYALDKMASECSKNKMGMWFGEPDFVEQIIVELEKVELMGSSREGSAPAKTAGKENGAKVKV